MANFKRGQPDAASRGDFDPTEVLGWVGLNSKDFKDVTYEQAVSLLSRWLYDNIKEWIPEFFQKSGKLGKIALSAAAMLFFRMIIPKNKWGKEMRTFITKVIRNFTAISIHEMR